MSDVKIQNHGFDIRPKTREEAQRRGRLGGLKKGENYKYRKTLKDSLDWYLNQEITTDTDIEKELLQKFPGLTKRDAIAVSATAQALRGDVKAMTFIRDTVDGPPTHKLQVDQDKPFEITITTIE